MSVKQISVFLENKPGTLCSLTEVLSKNNIDIRALTLSETKDFGIVRLIVDDVLDACAVLKEEGFVNALTAVLAIVIPDETGGLNKLLKVFEENKINVEYMYATPGGKNSKAPYMIFRVTDTEVAEKALAKTGLEILDQESLY